MCDSNEMYEILIKKIVTDSQLINDKIYFINQLTNHRNLKIKYKIIESEKNLATKNLSSSHKNSTTKNSREFI